MLADLPFIAPGVHKEAVNLPFYRFRSSFPPFPSQESQISFGDFSTTRESLFHIKNPSSPVSPGIWKNPTFSERHYLASKVPGAILSPEVEEKQSIILQQGEAGLLPLLNNHLTTLSSAFRMCPSQVLLEAVTQHELDAEGLVTRPSSVLSPK
ncbi:hypothetical protein ACLOJK_004560 [Asimina triloba]